MNWDREHSRSEKLSIEAELARRAGDALAAENLYRQAGAAEAAAVTHVPADKQRTRGITAISAVALWYKGRDYATAERLAHQYMAAEGLPPFARVQLLSGQ